MWPPPNAALAFAVPAPKVAALIGLSLVTCPPERLTLLAASDTLLPPYIDVRVMIEGYDPERAVLVVVHTTPLFMVYRLDRSPGAPPPDAPLIDFDQ